MPEGINTSGIENKKTNKEMVNEIRKEYPKFKIFWNAVLEQVREGKGQIYFGDNPSPLYVARFIASKLSTVKEWNDIYVRGKDENLENEMPVSVHKNCMNMLQQALGFASDVYYGETEILNQDGKINSNYKL